MVSIDSKCFIYSWRWHPFPQGTSVAGTGTAGFAGMTLQRGRSVPSSVRATLATSTQPVSVNPLLLLLLLSAADRAFAQPAQCNYYTQSSISFENWLSSLFFFYSCPDHIDSRQQKKNPILQNCCWTFYNVNFKHSFNLPWETHFVVQLHQSTVHVE